MFFHSSQLLCTLNLGFHSALIVYNTLKFIAMYYSYIMRIKIRFFAMFLLIPPVFKWYKKRTMGINGLNIHRGARSKHWRPKSSRNEVNLFGKYLSDSRNIVPWKVESHRTQFLYYNSLLKSIFEQSIITSKGDHFLNVTVNIPCRGNCS